MWLGQGFAEHRATQKTQNNYGKDFFKKNATQKHIVTAAKSLLFCKNEN